MADEEKKYLINVEDNLDEYAKRAKEAQEAVDRFIETNKELLASADKASEEYIKASAELKVLQNARTNATKAVENAVRVQKAEVGSYEQLYQAWKNAQTQLKLMPNAFTTNAQGVKVLSAEYLKQKTIVEDAKRSLDAFGKGVADNRLNVGNYSEAIEGAIGKFQSLPGPIGNAVGAVKTFGTAMKGLLLNPVTAAITAVVGALSLLVKAFKGNDEASEKFAGIMKGIGLAIKEVLGRIVTLGQAIGKLFKGEFAEAATLAKEAVTGFGESLKNAYGAGVEQQKLLNEIEDREIELIEIRAKREKEIAELKNKSRDAGEGSVKQAEFLRQAQELINKNLQDELALQKQRVSVAEAILAATNKNQITDEQRRAVAEERAKLYELETRALTEQGGLLRRLNSLDKMSLKDKEALTKEMEKQKATLQKEIDDYKKWITDRKTLDAEALADKREKQLEEQEWDRERRLTDAENLLAVAELNGATEFSIRRQQLELMRQQELANAEQTGADLNIINQKYADASVEIAKAEQDAKLAVYGQFAGVIAQIFGEQTAIGKIAAVAEATINTYLAATKALSAYPPPANYIAMASTIATGLLQVRKILAVKSGLPGDNKGGGSVPSPSAIASSPPVQRITAQQVGSSVLTQPILTQGQINTLPNQNLLTAEDIATAISKMPPPIVTVEDINARMDSVKKVEVRGTI